MTGLALQEAQNKQPSVSQSLLCISGMLYIIFFGLFVLKTCLQSILLISLLWVIVHALYHDGNQKRLKSGILSAIEKSVSVFLFFILIGAVIAAFTLSGAISTLIYYGLYFISPQNFLVIGMILCSLMSLATGSCWGTISCDGSFGVSSRYCRHSRTASQPQSCRMDESLAHDGHFGTGFPEKTC